MGNEVRKRLDQVEGSMPIGELTPINRKYARDEAGRVYDIMPVEQKEAIRKQYEKARGRSDSEPFFFTVMKNVDYVTESLTTTQRGLLLRLARYVSYDGRLLYGNKTMTTAQMRNVLGLTDKPRTFYDFLGACMNHGIMTKNEETGTYSISRGFHFRGRLRKGDAVTMTMINQLEELGKELKDSELGILYSLFQFVHVSTNYIVKNPEEIDLMQIQRMTVKEIAAAANMHEKAFNRAINRMKFRGGSMFIKIEDAGKKYLVMHPLLMVRNKEAISDFMRVTFRIKDEELR